MERSNFENLFKQSSEIDRDFAFEESSWNDLEARLDKKKKRRYLGLWLFLGIGLLGIMGYAMKQPDLKLLESSDSSQKQQPELLIEDKVETPVVGGLEKSKPINFEVQEERSEKEAGKQNVLEQIEPPSEQLLVHAKLKSKDNTSMILSKSSDQASNTSPDFARQIKNGNKTDSKEQSHEAGIIIPENIENRKEKELNTSIETKIEKPEALVKLSKTKKKSDVVSSQRGAPRALEGTHVNLEGAKSYGLDLQLKGENTTSDRLWEVGLTFAYFSEEYRPGVSTFTSDTTQFPPTLTPVASLFITEDGTTKPLYFNGVILGENAKKSFEPIVRLSVGRQLSKWVLARGGLTLLSSWSNKNQVQRLIDNNDFEYAVSSTSSANTLLFDLGVHIQPNHKRLKPFLGIGLLFTLMDSYKFENRIYNSNKELVTSEFVSSGNRYTTWGTSLVGLDIEAGVKYELTPRMELGLELFTVMLANVGTDNSTFLNPQLALQFNYKL